MCVCSRFKMAENIDSELKRMAQDLKEIIDQMNSANSNQDEDSTVSAVKMWTGLIDYYDGSSFVLGHLLVGGGGVKTEGSRLA